MNPSIVNSFHAILGPEPHCLILGSAPSVDSLKAQQYYGHARNAFWPIVLSCLTGQPLQTNHVTMTYDDKMALLKNHGIALWDVFAQCERQGSLDHSITMHSAEINPINELMKQYPSIRKILCNGKKAHDVFTRCVVKPNADLYASIDIISLPSTSPAHASLSIADKKTIWQPHLAPC